MTSSAQQLTPALLDLMDHEKVIEQGLATFMEVGNSLLAIRDGKKYQAADYATFELYCRGRWRISKQHAGNLMRAASTVAELETETTVSLLPIAERQVRPLTALEPSDRGEAWAEAVDAADGGQPTAAEVQAAVDKRKPMERKVHPARFSDPILDVIAARVAGANRVLDPFAGTGRVHELRERAGVTETVGVEIEPEWAAMHPDTIEGDALDLPFATESVEVIATSPTYGNRMADHHNASDDSVRNTYRHTLDHDLHEHNSGQMQWGHDYREFHWNAWAESLRVLQPGGKLVLNVKDHIRDGVKQEVVAWHIDTLTRDFDMELVALDIIPTKGLMSGENAAVRVGGEVVLTFRRAA